MYEKLSTHYGGESIFRDIDNIQPAANFRKVIGQTLRRSELVLVVIGPRWRGPFDGKHRIEDSNDWVRMEVETALHLDIPIIPVLIEGAGMPKPEEVPDSLKEFTMIQAIRVDPGQDFQIHMKRLIDAIDQILLSSTPRPAPTTSPGATPPSFAFTQPSSTRSFLSRVILPVRFLQNDSIYKKIGKVILLIMYYEVALYFLIGVPGHLIGLWDLRAVQ
jgi:TIR domain